MTRQCVLVLAMLAVCPVVPIASGQETPKPSNLESVPAVTALMVDVTISRYLGEKRLSSTPYTLAVNPGSPRGSSLRMGGEIPIPSVTFTPVAKDDAKAPNPLTSFGYRSIGTNIDVTARDAENGRYTLTVAIDETSVYPEDLAPPSTKTTGAPAFRGFKSTNALALRDGQSVEYTTATDRLTGEVYRVTVKMVVIK